MKYKSQHFVPQCYLRQFSEDRSLKTISLYNLKKSRCISGASIKGQCARDYFYDRTGAIDKILGGYEGRYSTIVKRINSTENATDEELRFLRFFAFLQYLRTEAMATLQSLMFEEMRDFTFHDDPEGIVWATFDPKEIPKMSIPNMLEAAPMLAGLQDRIFINRTTKPLISSDNPCVITNRFHVQRNKHPHGGEGILQSGFTISLPISPKIYFVSYDAGVYASRVDSKGQFVISKARDIEALNALQILKASENLYFNSDQHNTYIENLANNYRLHRPDRWYKWTFASKDLNHSSDGRDIYSAVKTPDEFRSGEGLMHLQSVSVNPGLWCSLLSIKEKPRFYDTNSGAGLIRSRDLYQLDRAFRRDTPAQIIPRPSK